MITNVKPVKKDTMEETVKDVQNSAQNVILKQNVLLV